MVLRTLSANAFQEHTLVGLQKKTTHSYNFFTLKIFEEFLGWHNGISSVSGVPGHSFDPHMAQWVKDLVL